MSFPPSLPNDDSRTYSRGPSLHSTSTHPQGQSHVYPVHPAPQALPQQSSNTQGWSSNDTSNYSAVYEAEAPSSIRRVRGRRTGTLQGGSSGTNTSKRIKGRDFGYAIVGKEAEQYVQEELRNQLASSVLVSFSDDPIAPSPLAPTKVEPQMVVREFKKAGHLDATSRQLSSAFQSSEYKKHLLQSLEDYLLQRLGQMSGEARQRLASSDARLQQLELTRWIEESSEGFDIIQDLMERLGGRGDVEKSLLNSASAVGKDLESRLKDIVQAETRRVERRTEEDSDEEGNSTPLNKGSIASGSQTPMPIFTETS